jgi:hypothetical protein
MYDVALGVAGDRTILGEYRCVPGDVLYLALEDGPGRISSRIDKILSAGEHCPALVEFQARIRHKGRREFFA